MKSEEWRRDPPHPYPLPRRGRGNKKLETKRSLSPKGREGVNKERPGEVAAAAEFRIRGRHSNMAVTVKYFASLREHHGADRLLKSLGKGTTVADIWARASNGEALPDNVLMAVNLECVGADHPVEDGDEVAFFPPVTGG